MSLVKAACMTAFSWLLADEDSSSRAVESGRHGLRTKLLDGTERETHETARRLTTLSIVVEPRVVDERKGQLRNGQL